MIKACLFDLDGVIVDTAKFHFIAWQELANSLGIEFTEVDNESLKGVGRMESLDFILSLGDVELSIEEKKTLADKKNENYKHLISELNSEDILPGVLSFLQELGTSGIRIGLGSSSKNARPVLEYLNLKSYFEVIVDGTNISKSKPDPQVFTLGAEGLNLDASEIVVFEDAQAGIDAARTGGFMCIGVGNESDLKNSDHVISGFESFSVNYMKSIFPKS